MHVWNAFGQELPHYLVIHFLRTADQEQHCVYIIFIEQLNQVKIDVFAQKFSIVQPLLLSNSHRRFVNYLFVESFTQRSF